MEHAAPSALRPAKPNRLEIQALYDNLRYLDAYEQSRPLWTMRTLAIPAELDARDLVLGARLAGRLGNSKLSRRLLREAQVRDPAHEEVRYFARYVSGVRSTILDQLRAAAEANRYAYTNPVLAASARATDAALWAAVRCFDRAFTLADEALAAGEERAWVRSCRALVLQRADQPEAALAEAEEAWRLQPGLPAAAHELVNVLHRLERLEEAAERLWQVWPHTQSLDVAQSLLHALFAAMERDPALEARWSGRAQQVLDRLPALAPLAGREAMEAVDHFSRHLALLRSDRARLQAAPPAAAGAGFWSQVREHALQHPDAPGRRILPHRARRQRHNTCLPASLATVTGALGQPVEEEALGQALTFGGTSVWRAEDWLQARGYATVRLRYEAGVARTLVREAIPFVLLFSWDTSGHATAVVGGNELAGTLIVHDPSQTRLREFLLDRVAEEESPLGPEILVVVPAGQADRVRALCPADAVARRRLLNEHQRQLETGGAAAAAAVVARLEQTAPDSPETAFVQAVQDIAAGRSGAAAARLRALGHRWPDCAAIRRMLNDALDREDNLAQLRTGLQTLVEGGRLPGVEMDRRWTYPPPYYAARYAELLSRSADRQREAGQVVRRALRYAPYEAALFDAAGLLLQRQRRPAEALLPFEVASALAEERHDYARRVCDLYRLLGREEDGLAFLLRRAERWQQSQRGRAAWITRIVALEDYGWPDRAGAELRAALATGDPGVLLPFAVAFFARQGAGAEAQAALDTLARAPERLDYLRAATAFHAARGEWMQALATAEEWQQAAPDDLAARRHALSARARRDGVAAACQLARSWVAERPGHDELELILISWLDHAGEDDEAYALLQQRTRRHGEDAWAWRELAYRALARQAACPAEAPERAAYEQAVDEAERQACRIAPDDAATVYLTARRRERAGDHDGAVALYFKGLELEPENSYGYGRICDLLPRLPDAEQESALHALEACMTRTPGQWHAAGPLAQRFASYRGLDRALEALDRWARLRPRDPELMEARADLLVGRGQGRHDAERALPDLEAAVAAFPGHLDLKHSLACALRALGRTAEEEHLLRGILLQHPAHALRLRLAELLRLRQAHAEAEQLLRAALASDPLDQSAWLGLAEHLWRIGRAPEAIQILQDAVQRLPEQLRLREVLTDRMLDAARFSEARQLADAGVARFPNQPTAWFQQARALDLDPAQTELALTESAYARVLALAPGYYDAADRLSVLRAQRHDFAGAAQVLDAVLPHLADPTPARARQAWLLRRQGALGEAVEAMHRVVTTAPWHAWGWRTLMEWLAEDEAWERARAWLEHWPAALADDAPLRAQRLDLLRRASADETALRAEWARMLHDFPNDQQLLCCGFDYFWEQGDKDKSEQVLLGRVPPDCDNPYLLARQVRVLAWRRRENEALPLALRIWFQPDQDSAWAQNAAWSALAEIGLKATAALRISEALSRGEQPGLPAFDHFLNHCAGFTTGERWPQRNRWDALFSRPVRRLREVLAQLDAVRWDPARYRALVLSRLDDIGYSTTAVHLWQRHGPAWQNATPIWQQAAHAALNARSRQTLSLLREWQARDGCEMFIVSNLTIALGAAGWHGRHGNWPEIARHAGECLDRLRHDHTARFLACNLVSALLLQGKEADFLAAVERWRHYLAAPEQQARSFWQRGGYESVPVVLLHAERLVRGVSDEESADLRARICAEVERKRSPLWGATLAHELVRRHNPACHQPVRAWWARAERWWAFMQDRAR